MKLLEQPLYRFADTEFDPARNCLRRNGQEHLLRQKGLQVLRYLIEHRERSVSKEELLENVWTGTAVTDDALVQIIVELRKLLGDDSRQPRFIRTIPKAGYRFIAPVETVPPTTLTVLPPGTFEVEEITSVHIEYAEEVSTPELEPELKQKSVLEPVSKSGLVLPPVNSLASQQAWRQSRPMRLALLGGGLVALAVLAGVFLGKSRQPAGAEVKLPRVPGKRAVAVLYFENQSGDQELDWLREGLADMLITNLSRSRRLTLLSRQQLAALLDHSGYKSAQKLSLAAGQELGRRAQAEVLVLGRFARLGAQVRIDVTLHEAQSGQIQAAESLVAERPELILSQLDLLSLKLATHLGVAPAQEDNRGGLAAAMTSNLDAYRYYSLALEQVQMFQFNEAVALLEKALALDPQFALAVARIGYIYAVRLGQGEKARPYLAQALRLSAELPGRLNERDKFFIAAWSASADANAEQTIAAYRDLLARYPLETEAYQRLGWVLHRLDRNDEAVLVTRQGLLSDPEGKDLYNLLGSVCLRLRRYDEALTAFQRYTQLAPHDPNAWDSLGEFHQGLGQYEQAAAAYSRALSLNPESRVAVIHLGNLYFRQGRYRAALEQYQRHFQIARDDGQRTRSLEYFTRVYLQQGDLARAAANIPEEMKYNSKAAWSSFLLALARGDHSSAQKFSAVFLTPAYYNANRQRGLLRFWNYPQGLLALRQGRAQEALNHFRAVVQQPPPEWYIDSLEDCLANAYLELGRLDEAIAEYERILKINPNYPLAHYHLGQAYESTGARTQARAAYARFLQVWQAADADIPEVVKAKAWLASNH